MLDAGRRHARPDLVCLVGVAAERLLAEHVLAGLGRRDRRLGVHDVRAAVVEEADRRVGDDVAPVGRPALVAVPVGGVGDRGLVPAGDGDEPRQERRRPGDMADVQEGARVRLAHERVAEHPDADLRDVAGRRGHGRRYYGATRRGETSGARLARCSPGWAYDFGSDERDRSTRRRGPALVIRGRALSGPAAEAVRPAAPPRRGDHLAAGARSGRVRLQPVDRPDPDRDRHLRRARGRDRLPAATTC